jgi:hypothetical protein
MKIFSRFWIFLLLCIGLVGCSLVPNELKIAEKLIETAPDSALHILQHLSPDKYKSDDSRALYGLLMIEVLDKKMQPLKPDTLLDFSIAYYEQQMNKERLGTCYFYRARQFKNSFLYEKAIVSYLKVIDLLEPNKKNLYLLGKTNSDLGQIYFTQGDFTLARQKYTVSYSNFIRGKFMSDAMYSLIDIGRTYNEPNTFKIAGKYFKAVIGRTKDSLIVASSYQEIGLNFIRLKQYDSAVFYIKKIADYPYIKNNKAIRYYLVANAYFELKKIDSAFIFASNSFKYQPDIRTQRECYRILTNSEYLRGNMKEMSTYMNKYVHLGDSLRKIDAQTKGSYIESMHDTRLEVVKTKQWVWYLVVIISIVIGLSIFLYYRLRKRKDKELTETKEKHKEQKETLHKDVMLKHRKALLLKIETTKMQQSEKRKKLTSAEKDALDKKLYNDLLHFNDTEFFFRQMDAILNNLVTKLKERYTGVSNREISWCCFVILNIPLSDTLLMLDYKINTLNKMKQRLATKFNLDNAFELVPFLNDILSEE